MFHLTALLVCQLLAPVVIDGVDVTGWTPAQLWTRSDEYFHAGAYDKAVRLQERIMVLDPGDVEAYTVAAWLTWSLGDEPRARQYLDRAVAANPNAWEAHWELGFHLFDRLGAAAEAIGPLARAVALPGCSDPAYRTLAHAYLAAERPSLAVALWTRIAAEKRAPPPVLDINLHKAWSQALRSDSRARAGGVVQGQPSDILPVLLDEQRLDDDADGFPDRRTQLYADPTVARDRVAIRHAPGTGAVVENRDGLLTIGQQRDLAYKRIDPCHLAQNAGSVEHGRARQHACILTPIHHDPPRVRVGRIVKNLCRLGRHLQALAQVEQSPQAVILLPQLIRLVGALRQQGQLLARGIGLRLCAIQGLKIPGGVIHHGHGLEHEPLGGIQHGGHDLAQRFCHPEARICHHQKQRQGAVQDKLGKGRGPLPEEGGGSAVQGSKRHGASRSGVAHGVVLHHGSIPRENTLIHAHVGVRGPHVARPSCITHW